MKNKDSEIAELKNRVITPEIVESALSSLPHNYLGETADLLADMKQAGLITKTYTKRYISKVKTEDAGAFNEDILKALVHVGLKHQGVQMQFGRRKKTSKTN